MINKNEFENRMSMLNTELMIENKKITLYIAGGMALILTGVNSRTTTDIDAFKSTNKEIEALMDKYDINFEISKVVKNKSFLKHSSLAENFNFSNIELYILSPTYLFVLKCLALISPVRELAKKKIDAQDVEKIIGYIVVSEIDKIIEDISKNSLNDEEKKYLKEEVEKWIKKI